MTTNSIAYNRTLFLEDNLPVLRGLDSKSVDLIATDPPFNKGVPAFEGTTKAGVNVEFKDVWNWDDDVQGEWIEQIRKKHPSLFNVIHYTNEAAGDDMGAFLCFMAVRMLEMHRVLKDTGSIYLHCDPTASHYLKAMMDAIFGRRNFRNEIVWKRQSSNNSATKKFGAIVDYILFYVKSDKEATWNQVYHKRSDIQMKRYRHDADGRLYKTENLTAPSPTPSRMFEWRGATPKNGWRHSLERLEELWAAGRIKTDKQGRPRLDGHIQYLDETADGQKAQSIWTDIPRVGNTAKERTGYPTQKPLALYKRIIEASSNPGDIVLDPFAGCATTCVAAEQLDRQWICIDIEEEAGGVILDRLQNEVNAGMAWNEIVQVLTVAPERTDDGEPAGPEIVLESPKKSARKIPLPELRKRLIADYGLVCQGCGWVPPWEDDSFLEADHMKPSKVGGEDKIDNRALLCPPCNGKKSFRWSLQELRGRRYEENRMTEVFLAWWETEGKWDGGSFDGRLG